MKKLNESALEIGDIILTTTNRLPSKGIRKATKSDISHAMVYVQSHSVIDATPDGVHSRNTQRLFFDDNCAVHVLRLIEPLSPEKMRHVTDYARSCVGTEYSTKEAIRTVVGGKKEPTRKQFCSRLVARAYVYGGVALVRNPDYCTPSDIQQSTLLRPVEHSIHTVTQVEVMEGRASTPQKMLDATNFVLNGARKISAAIQNFDDLNRCLMEHPEHDHYIASLYKDSGYISVWALEKSKNEWQYDFQMMNAIEGHDIELRGYCEDLLKDAEEGLRRFETNLAGYSSYVSIYKLETFELLHGLYTKLVGLHKQRVKVAQAWLTNH